MNEMDATTDDIDQLLRDAKQLEYGPTRTALCEEAVRLADTYGYLDKSFEARMELVNSSSLGGQPDLMLATFSWCLSTADKNPSRFGGFNEQYHILWQYKWVLGSLPEFPHIPKSQIFEVLGDMRERYQKFGSTMHGYYTAERSVYEDLGDKKNLVATQKKFNRTPRDFLSDCAACVQDSLISYHQYFSRYEQAVAAAPPILAGRLQCATVPQRTYSKLLNPLFRLGRIEEAMRYHRTQFRAIDGRPGFVGYVEDHVEFLALTNNLARAVRIAERHLPMILAYPAPSMQRLWFRTLTLLFALLTDSNQKSIKFRFPEKHAMKTPDDRTTPEKLAEYFEREARAIAAAYDTRNGTDMHTQALNRVPKLMKLVHPYPVSPHRRLDPEDAS